ncbi:arginine--tRNA ligase [Candidatus Nitrosocosmicus franklandus]|uniref:arginine--tRNA ligase n=1 Tax=Candidatus Nitrosocosmicus franklandianus TaxID=1798806 RepID=A0A484IKL2_9ARCH|nr:arginine--tRNA ligase [Candidatus Nitrosocosmicus franklandus]VFJ15449.1 Arginine--tRNA ligase [Candidatus Nitrosocosmicus franklandus]
MILEEIIEEIGAVINEVLTFFELGSIKIDYDINEPPIPEFGDFSTNICFQLAKIVRKPPLSIAEEIVKNKLKLSSKWKSRRYIEIASFEKPGFINFTLNKDIFLLEFLQNTNQKTMIVTPKTRDLNNNDTIIIEHTSVNPNKSLHVGHLRNAIIGDCLYRIFKKVRKEVKVLNYVDDSGLQVADIIVGFKYAGMSLEEWKSGSANYSKFDQYCGNEVYVKINELYKQRPELIAYRAQVMRELENPLSEISSFTNQIVSKVLIDQLKTTWNFRIHYDLLNFESQIIQSNLWHLLFKTLKDKKIVRYETEGKNKGCWIYSSPKEGDKVIIRSDSTLTYFAKDIPYAVWKLGFLKNPFGCKIFAKQWDNTYLYSTTLQDQNIDDNGKPKLKINNEFPINFNNISRVITVIDSRQERLQTLMIEILAKIGTSSSKYEYLGYEPVILSGNTMAMLGIETIDNKAVQMSGRKGIFVEADLALAILEERARSETEKRNPGMPQEELSRISREIAISAIRYYFIKFDFGKIINFDINDSLSLEGDTAPYIQYAYARGKKIEDKLNTKQKSIEFFETITNLSAIEFSKVEIDLIKHLCKYTIKLSESSEKANPKIMAKYLYQLATLFNNFYESSPIISESNANLAKARLKIMQCSMIVFEHCMEIIGISTLSRM